MKNERIKGFSYFFIFCFILFISTSLDIIKYNDMYLLSFNGKYFTIDRYKNRILGKYKIISKYGDIYLRTGDIIINHKGYLGTLFYVNNHTLNLINNDLNNIDSIEFYKDTFSINIKQNFDIFGIIFKIKGIYFDNEIINVYLVDFPDEIILDNNTSIKIIHEDETSLFNYYIEIKKNQLCLVIENYNNNKHYFIIKQNDGSFKCTNIITNDKWDKIIYSN